MNTDNVHIALMPFRETSQISTVLALTWQRVRDSNPCTVRGPGERGDFLPLENGGKNDLNVKF